MDLQRMKLLNIKQRILNGEKVESTRLENGEYIVRLANGSAVTFDGNYRPQVDNTIRKAQDGVQESAGGDFVM